ncbi:MAG: hypothetical protein Q8L48_38555 [Archangium sp.]|nr:hypothetical protein [Archangium sp.]
MRAILCVALGLGLSACLDFDKLIDDCDAGLAPCAGDGGSNGGGGGSVTGGGGGTTGGGGAGGGTGLDASTASPDCDAGVGATLQSPDGSTAFCFNGFAWENPLPHGTQLSTVWGPAPDDLWAAGAAGLLMHWDGASWTSYQGRIPAQVAASRLGHITSIVRAPGRTWLAGHDLMPHFLSDAGTWVLSNQLNAGQPWRIDAMTVSPDGLRGPYAVSSQGDVYAVPGWTRLFGPVTTEPPDSVRSAAIRDDGFCAFSGHFYNGPAPIHRVWSCDGSNFWTFDAGAPGALWVEGGVLLAASTNTSTTPSSMIWVLDAGAAELRFNLPHDVVYNAASSSGPGVGYLVGSRGSIINFATAEFTTPGARTEELLGVQAFAGDGSFAVGRGGALFREAGGNWVWQQQGFVDDLYGVWMQDDGGTFFTGQNSLLIDRNTGERVSYGAGTLRGLHRLADGSWLFASENGKLYDSSGGPAVYEGQGAQLNDLLVDEDEAWAVGLGTVVHRVGGGWVEDVPPGPAREWWKLARQGSRFLVVGSMGATAVYTLDAGWNVRTQPIGTDTLYGVWTIDPTAQTAWVVGSGPQIWLYSGLDGGFRSQNIMGASGAFYDVWGAAPNDVWAVGDEGQALHFDGTRWTAVETGTRQKLERVRSRALPGGGRELVIVGEHGTVLRKRY